MSGGLRGGTAVSGVGSNGQRRDAMSEQHLKHQPCRECADLAVIRMDLQAENSRLRERVAELDNLTKNITSFVNGGCTKHPNISFDEVVRKSGCEICYFDQLAAARAALIPSEEQALSIRDKLLSQFDPQLHPYPTVTLIRQVLIDRFRAAGFEP